MLRLFIDGFRVLLRAWWWFASGADCEVNYHAQTEPVMAHYDAIAACTSQRVNGTRKPAEVWEALRACFTA